MFSDVFLAQTAWEATRASVPKRAYMACHFSSGSKGLSNLPTALPTGSILLVDDSIPPAQHDPEVVAGQLREIITQFSLAAVLLDFQGAYTKASSNI